jgi:hypothetical protein
LSIRRVAEQEVVGCFLPRISLVVPKSALRGLLQAHLEPCSLHRFDKGPSVHAKRRQKREDETHGTVRELFPRPGGSKLTPIPDCLSSSTPAHVALPAT